MIAPSRTPVYDVFVSYARIDNEPFGPERAAWVTQFTNDLQTRLGMLVGDRAQVWRDPRLRGNEIVWQTIEDALRDAAALVSVVSPRYISSDSCAREVTEFVEHWTERASLNVGNRTRLFKVLKTRVPREQLLGPLRDINGYDFYREDPDTRRFRELALDADPEVRRLYWIRLDDLAQDITALLEDLGSEQAPSEPGTGAVYVAQTTRDVRDVRDAVARELKDRGVEVLPAVELPDSSDELQTAVRGDIERARFSVHVVGSREGFVPEGDTRSVVQIQYELALAGRTPGIVWHPADMGQQPGGNGDSASAAAVLDWFTPTATQENGFELLKGSLDQLKLRILARLAGPSAVPGVPGKSEALGVYLVHLKTDAREAEELEARLATDLGPADEASNAVHFSRPLARGTPAELRIDHETKLRSSDVIVVMCARAEPLWIATKHQELRRAGAQNLPSKAVVFYQVPPGVTVTPYATARSVEELLALMRRSPS